MYTLGKHAILTINAMVDSVFDLFTTAVLGPSAVPHKFLFIGHDPAKSLPGLFDSSALIHGHQPNESIKNQLISVSLNYINATKEKAKAQIINEIQASLATASNKNLDEAAFIKQATNTLETIWDGLKDDVKRIVAAEANTAKNFSIMDGIIKINAGKGINDPVIYFITPIDKDLCDECARLHLLKDRVTPRCWYLSEVGMGYHKKGDPTPKMSGLHPYCRGTVTGLLNGYGFVGGSLKYISKDWSEIEHQRR